MRTSGRNTRTLHNPTYNGDQGEMTKRTTRLGYEVLELRVVLSATLGNTAALPDFDQTYIQQSQDVSTGEWIEPESFASVVRKPFSSEAADKLSSGDSVEGPKLMLTVANGVHFPAPASRHLGGANFVISDGSVSF